MLEQKCLSCKSNCGVVKGTELIDPITDEVWGLCCKCKKFFGTNEKLTNLQHKLSNIKRKQRRGGGDPEANV